MCDDLVVRGRRLSRFALVSRNEPLEMRSVVHERLHARNGRRPAVTGRAGPWRLERRDRRWCKSARARSMEATARREGYVVGHQQDALHGSLGAGARAMAMS